MFNEADLPLSEPRDIIGLRDTPHPPSLESQLCRLHWPDMKQQTFYGMHRMLWTHWNNFGKEATCIPQIKIHTNFSHIYV